MPIAVTEDHESLPRHRAALGPDALPAHRAAAGGRGAARIGGAARRLGEDGGPGVARPPPVRGAGRAGLHAGGARRRAGGARSCPLPRTAAADGAGLRRPGPRAPRAGGRAAGVAPRPGRRLHHGGGGAGRGAPPLAAGGGRGAFPRGARCARCSGCPPPAWSWCPLDYGTGTGWLLLDREALGDAVSVEALPALDGTRAVGQLTIAGRRGHGAAGRAGHGVRRRRARPGPDAGRGRERGDRPLVPAHGLGVRQGARPVRPAHRPVPGGQARAGRHAGRRRAVAPRWPGTPRPPGARTTPTARGRRDPGSPPQRAHRRRRGARGGRALRQGVHSAPRRHRLHLGARRPPLPEAGHGQPAAGRRRRRGRARARGGRAGHRRGPAQPGGRPAARGGVAARGDPGGRGGGRRGRRRPTGAPPSPRPG